MAKEDTPAALLTPDMFPRRRGRPATGNAMTNAQRQARHRAKLKGPAPVDRSRLDQAAAILASIRADMVAQADQILMNRELSPHFERWFKQIHELGQSLSRP